MLSRIYCSLALSVSIFLHAPEDESDTKKVTVIGMAQNAKGNAIVVTADDRVYFLYGVKEWHKDYYGKKVNVSGKLKLITVEKIPDNPLVAQWYGTRRYIKKPKWVLIE